MIEEKRTIMNIREKLQIVLIVSGCVLLDIFLHVLTAPYGTMPIDPDLNFVAEIMGVETVAAFWAVSAFSVVAFVFLRIREFLPGGGVKKGFLYGASVALLWFLAMLEGVSLFGNPLINEMVVGLSDAIPVLLLGVSLGFVKPSEGPAICSGTGLPAKKHQAIVLFAAIFLAGRYCAYTTGVIKSGIQVRPVGTFLWTLLMGIAIGATFEWLDMHRKGKSSRQRVGEFALCVFCLNWGAFLMFMPLLFSGYIADVLIRIALDTSLVMIASYLTISAAGHSRTMGSGESCIC